MNIPGLSKKVINKCLERWFESNEEAPRLSEDDFRTVHQEAGLCISLDKFKRLSGLYLKQHDYIAGQFTQVWSVNGFHVLATGAAWAKQSFFEENKEVFLVALGAILSLAATVVINLTMPNELTLSKDSIESLRQVIKEAK